jgi:thioredoxin 1
MNYESHIQGNKPVIIDFFAEWSRACKLMVPILREVKETMGERAIVLNVDVEKEQELAALYDIQTVPTLMIFHRGQVLWRKNGFSSVHEILGHMQLMID